MSLSLPRAGRVRRLVVGAALATGLALAPVAPAAADELSLLLLNQHRASQGRWGLPRHDALMAKAQGWAQTLAAEGQLRHSHLPHGVPAGWHWIGENVAVGSNHFEAQALLVGSAPHNANMLDGRASHVGTGAAVGHDGRIYVVQVFAQF